MGQKVWLQNDIQHEGLMLGLKYALPAGDVLAALREQHMLAVGAGENVIRLVPPLNIGDEEVREACASLNAALTTLGEDTLGGQTLGGQTLGGHARANKAHHG